MHKLLSTVHLSILAALFVFPCSANQRCRNIPGDPGFPSQAEWDKFNTTIDGSLVTVVPSAKFCHELPAGNCPSDQWESTLFRTTVPGTMVNVCSLAHSAFSNMVANVLIFFSVQLGAGTPLPRLTYFLSLMCFTGLPVSSPFPLPTKWYNVCSRQCTSLRCKCYRSASYSGK